MNKKALSLAICLAMAIPTASNALSLGEIQSKSSLNQPFQGRINLLATTAAEAKNLRVRVASPDVFNRVGIDRPAFLNNIRFQTTVQNGKPVILVSSKQPINEPFLNFLLEVSWPNGQLLKEYTVLLDPPVLMRPNTAIAANKAGIRAEPVARGKINRPTPQKFQQQARQALAQSQAQQARRVASASAPAPVRNYRVRRGDTLSKIANNLGYQSISKEQMLVALFEKNRSAFSQSNMNNLKAGALIARPSLQEARALKSSIAKSLIIAQARAWKQKSTESIANKSANKARTEKVASTQAARMEVMGNTGSSDASGSSSASGSVDALNKQLAMITESLMTKSKENEELKSRVSELESLLRKKNRLITLKSEQLASLQAGLSGATTEAPEATEITEINETPETQNSAETNNQTEVVLPEPTVSNEGTDIQEQVAGSLANENGEIIRTPDESIANQAPVIDEVTQTEAKEPANTFKNDVVEESFDVMSLLGSPAAMGIGGGSLLALLGGLWFMRRRKSNDEEVEDFSDLISDGLTEQPLYSEGSPEDLNNDKIGESELVVHDEEKSHDGDSSITEEAENELDDLIQEADVYIVYGLHDQAESEIKRAISSYPNNAALHAKLLENYKAAGDQEAFEQATKDFLDLDADDKQNYWDEICEWGNALLPESKLYNNDLLKDKADAATDTSTVTGVAMVAGTAVAASVETSEDAIEETSDVLADDNLIEDTVDEYEKIDLDEDLEDFNLDDILGAADESESMEGLSESEMAETDLDEDLEDFDLDGILGAADESEPMEGLSESEIAEMDLDEDLEDFDLDDILAAADEPDSIVGSIESEIAEMDLDDDFEDQISSELEIDESEFALDDAALDALLESKDFGKESDVDHEIANLTLDLDADDFDKIMPEDHAYKATDAEVLGEVAAEDNLLADYDDNLSFLDLDDDSEVIEETQIETKIDLAKAYIDMGDIEGARSTLEEVMEVGNEDQKRQAEELLQYHG